MANVSGVIPNLINGISQQPAIVRLPSQGELQINAMASPVEGLRKRPPAVYRYTAGGSAFADASILPHLIDRSEGAKFQVLFSNRGIRATNLRTGEAVPVKMKDGAAAYLACPNPTQDLRALTVGDYTFVLNRTKTVATLPDLVPLYRPDACIWIKQGSFGASYTITIDGISVTYKTPIRAATEAEWTAGGRYVDEQGGVVAAPAAYTTDPPRGLPRYLTQQLVSTDVIGQALLNLLRNHPTLKDRYQFGRSGPLIRVLPNGSTTPQGTTYTDFTMSVTDSLGDTAIEGFKGKVQRFSDLPKYCFNGFRIKIMGDSNTEFDDYFVKFEGNKTSGTWVEEVADGELFKLDPATLPHALIRRADGTFSFEALDWSDRKAGDFKSNPMPSFTGRELRDLFFFRDRLGFVTQENVVMSRYGDYYNFFRASAMQVLDTDPIDVSVVHARLSDIHHAVSYNETLLLFGQDAQFQIGDVDLLTPKSVSFKMVTEFRCSPAVKPVGMGSHLYFSFGRGPASTVMEYYVDKQSVAKNGDAITDHVPKYIHADIRQIAACPAENMLFILCETRPNQVFVYNCLWAHGEKIQSAISTWQFDPACRILAMQAVASVLYLVMLRTDTDTVTVETVNLAPELITDGVSYRAHLDRQITDDLCSTVVGAEETTITLPFPATSDLIVVAQKGNPQASTYTPGRRLSTGYVEGEQAEYRIDRQGRIIVRGVIQKFWIGLPYTMRYRFSTIYARNAETAITNGRLQLRRLNINYARSSYFRVEVTPTNRPTQIYAMTAKTIGETGTAVGRVQVVEGTFKVPVLAQNTEVRIDIVNDTFLPCAFLSAEWEANFAPRSKRIQ